RAAAYFHRSLETEAAAAARRVLEQRQVTPDFVERFQIGYAPVSGLKPVISARDLVATGLFSRNDRGEIYDRFRHRLMFPIWNERGKVIASGGRALANNVEPKYVDAPETLLYSRSSVLYRLHLARGAAQRAGRLVVVEGYF